ncbi:hypothetical protein NL676_012475 [Syzygium grande]|nr:hypothetical protein NL676_012475 [Syzygium grande]
MGRGGKVCCRFDPLDFDPSRLPVRKFLRRQIKVRIKLPMSIRCDTCENHIRQGTKLHSRKEEVAGETPLAAGIKRFRFYFKCTKCSAVLTIKTYHPPQDPDYVVESGATRIFEPLTPPRDSEPRRKQDEVSGEAGEMGDVMNPLQNSTSDSKGEMAPDELNSTKKSKDFVRRIKDRDSEDEEDLTRPCASNDESLNNAFKKRKFSEELLDKPTDSLTKATTSNVLNDRVDQGGCKESCSNLQN